MPIIVPRLTFLKYGALLSVAAASRSTCPRARVGYVFFTKDKRVAATGFNGVPAGQPHCDEVGCVMVDGHCSRTTHAEYSACKYLRGRKLPGGYAFGTLYPCKKCFDYMTLKHGIPNIYWHQEYPHNTDKEYVEKMARKRGINMQKWPFDIVELLQETIDFHQGPGGLLVARKKLVIKEVAE